MRLNRVVIIAYSISLYFIALVLSLSKNILERSKKSFDKLRTSAGHTFQTWNYIILLPLFTISLGKSTPGLISFNATDIDTQTKEITINFTIPKKDFIYKDFITCSIDNPHITLSPWKANKPTVAHYDSSFKEAKQIFNEDFIVTLRATTNDKNTHSAYLYCSYYRHADKKINHLQFPLVFSATAPQNDETIDSTFTVIDDYEPIKKRHRPTIIERYSLMILTTMYIITASLHVDHKKYFAILLFLLSVLITFYYFFREELKKQIRIKELLEIIISLFMMIITAYLLAYTYIISTPLLTMIMASICALFFGLFYTKKSTQVQSKNLRTLCTFLGMLCICSTLLLSFKALQYADQQFNLL